MGATIKPWSDSLEEYFQYIEKIHKNLKSHSKNQFYEDEIKQASYTLFKIKKIALSNPRFPYQQWQEDIDNLYHQDPTIGGVDIKLLFSKSSSLHNGLITYTL